MFVLCRLPMALFTDHPGDGDEPGENRHIPGGEQIPAGKTNGQENKGPGY